MAILDDYSSDTSANYTKTVGDGTITVSSGEMHVSGYAAATFFHETALSTVNHYVQADVQYNSTGNDWSGICARHNGSTGASEDCYIIKGSDDTYSLYRRVDGSDEWLASFAAPESNSQTTLYMSVNGVGATVTIIVKQDGTTKITYSDTNAARLTAGSYIGGVISNSNSGSDVRFDNLAADDLGVVTSTKIVDPGEGVGHDYHSLSLWEAGEQDDITTATGSNKIAVAKCRATDGDADTTSVTIDGWTTSATEYIKIWTDPAEAFRHDGKYDTTAYRIECDDSAAEIIYNNESYTRFIGLQFKLTPATANNRAIFTQNGNPCYFDQCIFQLSIATAKSASVFNATDRNTIIYNSILYSSGIEASRALYFSGGTHTIYNCTIYKFYYGIDDGGYATVKNCAIFGNTDDFNGSSASIDYCASDDADGTNHVHLNENASSEWTNAFVDYANGNFHLKGGSSLIGTGVDLSGTFTTDIDGETRSGAWDIGADELFIKITVNDSTTVTESKTISKQGDRTVIVDPGNGTGTDYLSLSLAEAGEQGNLTESGDSPLKRILTITCRATNGTADTTICDIDGWTTDSTHYISITVDPAHRHAGVWSDSKYRINLNVTGASQRALIIQEQYTRVTGVQIALTNDTDDYQPMCIYQSAGGDATIQSCILKGTGNDGQYALGICSVSGNINVYNCLMYDFKGDSGQGLYIEGSTINILNCTIINCDYGINRGGGTVYAKNNLIKGCTTATAGLTGSANIDYNATDLSSLGYTAQSNDHVSHTFTFVGASDFHLQTTDVGAIGLGADLSGTFTTDVDSKTRTLPYDIGADQAKDTITKIVDPGEGVGHDYHSLNLWEAGEQGDLVQLDRISIASCRATDGDADTTACAIDGWTTDTNHYISVTVDTDHRHAGVYSESKYRLARSTTYGPLFGIAEEYVYIDGVQINNSASLADNPSCIQRLSSAGAGEVRISNCICLLSGTGTPGSVRGIYIQGVADLIVKIWNNIVYDSVQNIVVYNYAAYTVYCYNNIVYGGTTSGIAIEGNSGTTRLKNNLCNGNGSDYILSSLGGTTEYVTNLSEDSSSPNSILKETFNVSGYDTAGWSETVGGSNTINEDSTDAPPIGETGFSTQCLELTVASEWQACYTVWTPGSDKALIYFRGHLYVEATALTSSGIPVVRFLDSGGTVIGTLRWYYNNGTLWDLYFTYGEDAGGATKTGLSLNTSYQIDIKLNSAGGWEFLVDGSSVGSGVQDPGNSFRTVRLGSDDPRATIHYYWDDVVIADNGYTDPGGVHFVDEAGHNFHLDPTDTHAIGTGTDLHEDAYLAFATDIDGKTRTGTWDIGADQAKDTITKIVDPGEGVGHDYHSLSLAEAGEQGDLVQLDRVLTITCRATGGTADSTICTFNGWTLDANHYINITVDPAHRHAGVYTTSKYRLEKSWTTWDTLLQIYEDFVRVDGLQFSFTGGTVSNGIGYVAFDSEVTPSDNRVTNCIVKQGAVVPTGYSCTGIHSMSQLTAYNNIVYDFTCTTDWSSGICVRGWSVHKHAYLYNNTIVNCTIGINISQDCTGEARNNIIKGCTTATAGLTGSATVDYNATDLTGLGYTAQSNDHVSHTFTFVSASDFHLQATDVGAIGLGADLSGTFTTDIDNKTRTLPFDIGADQAKDTITKIVDPGQGSGHDYHSLALWEAGEQGDLVQLDRISIATCRATSGTDDTDAVYVAGWTTDSTHYIKIWTDPTESFRHSGKRDDTKYILRGAGWAPAIYTEATTYNIYLEGLQLVHNHASSGDPTVNLMGNSFIDQCIISRDSNTGVCLQVEGSSVVIIKNSVIDGNGHTTNGINVHYDSRHTLTAYNCTITNCSVSGVNRYEGTATVTNCAVFNNADDFAGTITVDYCASDDADGTNHIHLNENASGEWTNAFVDYANGDFHLKTGSSLIGVGVDLSGTFTTDIDNKTRTLPWDIGADQAKDTITKIVDPGEGSGHDYHSLSLWEAGEQGDLVQLDRISIATCRATGGTNDTDAVNITGWTTDATHYISITVDPAHRHAGTWDDSKYVLTTIYGGQAIQIREQYTRVDSIQIDGTDNVVAGIMTEYQTGDYTTITNCIIKNCTLTDAAGISFSYSTHQTTYNNIIYGCDTGIVSSGDSTSDNLLYNNTIANCTLGVGVGTGGGWIAKNNIFYNCTTPATGTFGIGTDYNATDHDEMHYTVTGGGNTHDHVSHTFTFVGASDFHLQATDVGAIGLGVDLSGTFTTDIDNKTRTLPYDIGADQAKDTITKIVDPGEGSGHDYHSLSLWEAGEQLDLVQNDRISIASCRATNGTADTTQCTVDGWTTDVDHYISITVDPAHRHAGVWDDSKYRFALNSAGNWQLTILEDYCVIDGIQFDGNGTDTSCGAIGIAYAPGDYATIKNCIIKRFSYVSVGQAIKLDYTSNCKIYNNIIYTGDYGIYISGNYTAGNKIYNNTIASCTVGISSGTGTGNVAKNNLLYECGTGATGTYGTGTDYNATDDAAIGYTVDGGGNTHDHVSHTFTFVGASDFHLDAVDTGAKDLGVDLSGTFTTDIDGNTRTLPWDIGADQAPKNVYYSTCPFGTGDIKTGSPDISITSGVATLTVEQTGNIGQGCRIEYDGHICYISKVNSSTSFDVVTVIGSMPDNHASTSVTGIKHEFASLYYSFEGAKNSNHLNTDDLTDVNVILNFCCYYDHDDYTYDSDLLDDVDGAITTDVTRYVNIYTPTGGTQSINNQRHDGKWNANKHAFMFSGGTSWMSLRLYVDCIRVTGLQFRNDSDATYICPFYIHGETDVRVDRCISFITNASGGSEGCSGIYVICDNGVQPLITNCISYIAPSSKGYAFDGGTGGNPGLKVYNCVGIGGDTCFYCSWGDLRNCIGFGGSVADFNQYTNTNSDYNASTDDTAPGTHTVDISGYTLADLFVDPSNYDFRLKSGSPLINQGVDLFSVFTNDVEGQTRPAIDIKTEYSGDNRNSALGGIGRSAVNYTYLAQTFQISNPTQVSKVSLYLQRTGNPTGTLDVKIYTDSEILRPDTQVTNASNTSVLASSVDTSWEMVDFTFASPVFLEANEVYWLVATISAYNDESNKVDWGIDTSSPTYTNGTNWYNSSLESSFNTDNVDHCFQIYGSERWDIGADEFFGGAGGTIIFIRTC